MRVPTGPTWIERPTEPRPRHLSRSVEQRRRRRPWSFESPNKPRRARAEKEHVATSWNVATASPLAPGPRHRGGGEPGGDQDPAGYDS